MKHAKKAKIALIVAVVLVPLYLLSVGPAHRLWYENWISFEAYDAYSGPAFSLARVVGKRCYATYARYLNLWVPMDEPDPGE